MHKDDILDDEDLEDLNLNKEKDDFERYVIFECVQKSV